jgi:hypothetical protein
MQRWRTFANYAVLPVILFAIVGLGYASSTLFQKDLPGIAFVSALIGGLSAYATQLWQTLSFNAPKLSVEVNSIARKIGDTALIPMSDDPDLQVLELAPEAASAESPGDRQSGATSNSRVTLPQLEDLLARAKEELQGLPAQIAAIQKTITQVENAKLGDRYEFDKIKNLFPHPIQYEGFDQAARNRLASHYKDRLDAKEQRHKNLQANLQAAERRVASMKNQLEDDAAFFIVSVSLSNSGRSNSAIKVPTLLRVAIGQENYINLKLNLKDFANPSEIPASGTRMMTFVSPKISWLPEEDRKLLSTYWGQTVNSQLYLEDIRGKIHSSKGVTFAEGLNERKIFDRLASAAGRQGKWWGF